MIYQAITTWGTDRKDRLDWKSSTPNCWLQQKTVIDDKSKKRSMNRFDATICHESLPDFSIQSKTLPCVRPQCQNEHPNICEKLDWRHNETSTEENRGGTNNRRDVAALQPMWPLHFHASVIHVKQGATFVTLGMIKLATACKVASWHLKASGEASNGLSSARTIFSSAGCDDIWR